MKKIYPKDWLALHPYQQANSVDQYYTRIANQIQNYIYHTGIGADMGSEDVVRCTSLCLAAWFEDVISGTGIWQTFTDECCKRYGIRLPFYPISDDYYPDEPNLEDIRFLLWHHIQFLRRRKESIINPENPVIENTAKLIYRLLGDEYEIAPENTRMQHFFQAPAFGEEDFFEYRMALEWFHYHCYFNIENVNEYGEAVEKLLDRNDEEQTSSPEYLQVMAEATSSNLAFGGRHNLLSLTSPEWLARIWERHSHNDLWASVKQREYSYYRYEREDEKYMYVSDLCRSGEMLKIYKSSMQLSGAGLKNRKAGETIFFCTLVSYGRAWWQCGALGGTDERDPQLMDSIKEYSEELAHTLEKRSFRDFMRGSGGKSFVFCRTKADIQNFLSDKVGYKEAKYTPVPDDIGKDGEGFLLTVSPINGSRILTEYLACIKSPDNPFYDEKTAKRYAFAFMLEPRICTYDLSCTLQDMGLLPDAGLKSVKGEEHGCRFLHDNAQFLTDYFHYSCRERDFPTEELNDLYD